MSNVLLWVASVALALGGSEKTNVLQLSGTDEAYSAVKQAAAVCRYNGIQEFLGEHLVPYLHIVIPKQFSPEYECLRRWLAEHSELGFGTPPAPKS